jgi:iron-sulfur cluster assembly protein
MIEISKAAIAEIKRMQTVRAQTDRKFRVGFANGGCKDFYYTIDLVDSTLATKDGTNEDHDRVYQLDGVSVSIDLSHLAYLDHLKLDYSEDLMGGGFRFQNPLATSVCGCGNSFSMLNSESASARWQLPT